MNSKRVSFSVSLACVLQKSNSTITQRLFPGMIKRTFSGFLSESKTQSEETQEPSDQNTDSLTTEELNQDFLEILARELIKKKKHRNYSPLSEEIELQKSQIINQVNKMKETKQVKKKMKSLEKNYNMLRKDFSVRKEYNEFFNLQNAIIKKPLGAQRRFLRLESVNNSNKGSPRSSKLSTLSLSKVPISLPRLKPKRSK